MSHAWTLGFDIGGTRLKAAAVSPEHRVLEHDVVAVDGSDFDSVLGRMEAIGARYVDRLGGAPTGIGVAIPGLVRTGVGALVLPGRTAGLAGFPLVGTLQDRFHVPVACLNDGTAAALGEWRAGAAAGCRSAACITIGTGIGGGAIVNGSLVGDLDAGLGSYLGHMSLDGDGDRCVCGNAGCAETLLSANAIVGRARAALARSVPTVLAQVQQERGGVLTFEDVVAASRAGDPLCVGIVARFARDLARFLVSIAHVLAPQAIVIGGGAAAACEAVLDEVRAAVARGIFALPDAAPDVRMSTLGGLAGVHGACALMMRGARDHGDAPATGATGP